MTKNSPEENLVGIIKSGLFISLDGVVESPNSWHFPYFNDEMGAAVGAMMAGNDAMLIGGPSRLTQLPDEPERRWSGRCR